MYEILFKALGDKEEQRWAYARGKKGIYVAPDPKKVQPIQKDTCLTNA